MDLKDIKAIIDLMKKNSISEFELEKEGFKIKLKRAPNGGGHAGLNENGAAVAPPIVPGALPTVAPPVTPPIPTDREIKSPMIGTFYRAPSPEAEPYVEVGSEVNPDTLVCIIEAMKVMNEIKAEVRGVISQVLVENGRPVEFSQPLFKIHPA